MSSILSSSLEVRQQSHIVEDAVLKEETYNGKLGWAFAQVERAKALSFLGEFVLSFLCPVV